MKFIAGLIVGTTPWVPVVALSSIESAAAPPPLKSMQSPVAVSAPGQRCFEVVTRDLGATRASPSVPVRGFRISLGVVV